VLDADYPWEGTDLAQGGGGEALAGTGGHVIDDDRDCGGEMAEVFDDARFAGPDERWHQHECGRVAGVCEAGADDQGCRAFPADGAHHAQCGHFLVVGQR
jgi:hypothetical protein